MGLHSILILGVLQCPPPPLTHSITPSQNTCTESNAKIEQTFKKHFLGHLLKHAAKVT